MTPEQEPETLRGGNGEAGRLPPGQAACPGCGAVIPIATDAPDSSITCPHCGANVPAGRLAASGPPEADRLLGSTLGGCKVLERVGQGAMAVVYKAEQVRLRRPVALKVMLPGVLARDERSVARFLTEARLAAQLDHPHIVQVYDVGQEAGCYYIVMQFVGGGSVQDLIRRRGQLEAKAALEIALQAARGLDAAHKCGMIHRDVKPSNLLLDSQGVVKVSDFGLAKSLAGDTQVTQPGTHVGTPCYMSPEQWRGDPLGPPTDIYSLGVTLFHMLAGQPPFEGASAYAVMEKHLHQPLPREALARAAVPRRVLSLVERMTAKGPAERPGDAERVVRDIEGILAAQGGPPEPRPAFDDRESFQVARAVLAVLRRRCPAFADDDAVWEAFIQWRGRGEGDYLRRIRAGGRYIFYALLHDLYDFAEATCGANVTQEVGRVLSDALLEGHMPDLLRTSLAQTGMLWEQIMWLVEQFVAGACHEIYALTVDPCSDGTLLRVSLAYRAEEQMTAYLERSGHEPERAFANSFDVFCGALRTLLARTIYGYSPEQFLGERSGLRGRFLLTLRPHNRFHYENIIDILLGYVRRLRERKEPEAETAASEAAFHASPAMQRTWDTVRKAAASDETVLLCGESGTGKSYYARRIHEMGARRAGPFVEVGLTADIGTDNLIQSNLFGHVRGAFTGAEGEKRGLFALADGGTIFLDEIGDASPELQARLLRVIESKSFKMLGGVHDIAVNVRILAATNQDIAGMVRQGRFREDLFYRLNVIQIALPPLRERREDIPALIQRLFDKVCREAGKQDKHLAEDGFACLCAHDWPGNVRELENALRRALAFADGPEVRADDLPQAVRTATAPPLPEAGAARPAGGVIDRDLLQAVLSTAAPSPDAPTYQWPGHIDYARREYLAALIDHYGGNLREIARHWDRSSENTLLKVIRAFGLEDTLRAARQRRR